MVPMQARVVIGSILLVLSSLLAACADESDVTKPGDIIKARADDQFTDGTEASVTIPTGRLLIYAADPVDTASADETRTRQAVDAPAGAVLVPITWQYDTWGSDRLDGIVASNDTPIVDLVSDGERYRLRPPEREFRGGESFYVVVDGNAEDRTLEIDFDGVTQTVDLTDGTTDEGDAAALYDIDDSRLKKESCDDPLWFDGRKVGADFTCDLIGPVLTPYAGGEWAPDGSLWLAFTLRTEMLVYNVTNLLGAGARYTATSVKVKAEIDGEEPTFEMSTNDDDDLCPVPATTSCGWTRHLVFEVPEYDGEQGPLDLKVAYRLAIVNSWGDWDPRERRKEKASEVIKLWKEPKDKSDDKGKGGKGDDEDEDELSDDESTPTDGADVL